MKKTIIVAGTGHGGLAAASVSRWAKQYNKCFKIK